MKFALPLLLVVCCALSPACRTQRTVLSGPTVTGEDNNVKDTAQTPAAAGMGTAGGSGFGQRFSSQDPYGYMQNANGGENVMSGKMFDGKLKEASVNELSVNRGFLTREYAGSKQFNAKNYQGAERKGPDWIDHLFETDKSQSQDAVFSDGGKVAATKEWTNRTREVGTDEAYREGAKTARTGNFYPAEKASAGGRDKPKLANAPDQQRGVVQSLFQGRTPQNPVSVQEIRSVVGKGPGQ